MQIEFMWKDENSQTTNSPSVSKVIAGPEGWVVVGRNLDAATTAQVQYLGEDETAVFVPRNVLARLRDVL